MGTHLDKISGPCSVNNNCWSTGVFDNPPVSPNFLDVQVSGVLPGIFFDENSTPPPNGNYILKQQSASWWFLSTGIIGLHIVMSEITTDFLIHTATPFPLVMFTNQQGGCALYGINDEWDYYATIWYGGIMRIIGIS